MVFKFKITSWITASTARGRARIERLGLNIPTDILEKAPNISKNSHKLVNRGVHLRVPHAKNQPPRPKTVAYSERTDTQTDTHTHINRHTEKAKKEGTYSSRCTWPFISLEYAFQYTNTSQIDAKKKKTKYTKQKKAPSISTGKGEYKEKEGIKR